MITYGGDEYSGAEMQFEKSEAVAVVSNLIEEDVSYHTLSRVVRKRLLPLLERLYSEGKLYYHIGLTSRRDVLVCEELAKFKRLHSNVKVIIFETTLYADSIEGFSESDVKRYYKAIDCGDLFIYHPIKYGENMCQKLNLTMLESVDTFIAYGCCTSSEYLDSCGLDVRYLLTDEEIWGEGV